MARILLIEDDEHVRTMLRLMLVRFGHAVIEAGNGRQGLTQFQPANFDLVITDLVMPEKEGIEVVIELRKHIPRVKIIAISGGGRANTAAEYLAMARGLGADLVLAKPFPHEALLAAINGLLPVIEPAPLAH
jgi:DNA-binding response OmpR family regulator